MLNNKVYWDHIALPKFLVFHKWIKYDMLLQEQLISYMI